MKIKLEDLKKNTQENLKIGSLQGFKERNEDLNNFDSRNQLNELNLLNWIRHSKSFHRFTKKIPKDIFKSYHPATFEEELPFYYIEFFSKKNELIFDPFIGTGTTSIAANLLGRRSIGIELNQEFLKLAYSRFKINELNLDKHHIFEGDCYSLLKDGVIINYLNTKKVKIDFTITSPPYHNILKFYTNKKSETSKKITNYGKSQRNLENIEDYELFLDILIEIFKEIYKISKNKSYLVINVLNYYSKVYYNEGKSRREIVFFAWDLAKKLCKTDWIPCGEQIWAYPNKESFPFGYPYVYISNISHSYNLIFYKDIYKKNSL